MSKKPYVTEENIIRVSTSLDLEPVDYQITLHIENLKAHYGADRVKEFLKNFYFDSNLPKNTYLSKAK